jgi:hypothetical protein
MNVMMRMVLHIEEEGIVRNNCVVGEIGSR